MNGIHDMGGTHGYGPIEPRQNEEIFHAEWEKRVPGLSAATRVNDTINIDESRHGIERMSPAAYLTSTYYERHLYTIELNLLEKGVLTAEEIEQRIEQLQRDPGSMQRRDDPAQADRLLRYRRHVEQPPPPDPACARYVVGDHVRTRNVHPEGHTRLPRYARGKRGVIDRFHGVETLPDANAHRRGPSPEPLYSVRFDAVELWGASADGRGSVYIDLWESYLEPLENDQP